MRDRGGKYKPRHPLPFDTLRILIDCHHVLKGHQLFCVGHFYTGDRLAALPDTVMFLLCNLEQAIRNYMNTSASYAHNPSRQNCSLFPPACFQSLFSYWS
jgi:hypothetical protein